MSAYDILKPHFLLKNASYNKIKEKLSSPPLTTNENIHRP